MPSLSARASLRFCSQTRLSFPTVRPPFCTLPQPLRAQPGTPPGGPSRTQGAPPSPVPEHCLRHLFAITSPSPPALPLSRSRASGLPQQLPNPEAQRNFLKRSSPNTPESTKPGCLWEHPRRAWPQPGPPLLLLFAPTSFASPSSLLARPLSLRAAKPGLFGHLSPVGRLLWWRTGPLPGRCAGSVMRKGEAGSREGSKAPTFVLSALPPLWFSTSILEP